MKKILFLYSIIFIEGYVVLSAELLAIRQIVPFVGNGTDTTSIIIAAVLMPLAFGYYAGGKFKPYKSIFGQHLTIRKKLLQNILISMGILFIGLSYMFIGDFFGLLNKIGLTNRLLSTSIYALIFLAIPVYLLAQTIPLVSHYFSTQKLSLITGKMLFFSTMGSFMGAVFTTLVLMATIGVHLTAVITIICLAVLYVLLSRKKINKLTPIIALIVIASYFMNSPAMLARIGIVESNAYNIVKIKEGKNASRIMLLNDGYTAAYTDGLEPYYERTGVFGYMQYIHDNYIDPIQNKPEKIYDILAIGAGGFTLGLDDFTNDYTFIDIDSSLKEIAEKKLLQQKLHDNKKFIASPARRFLNTTIQENQKFDLIVLDAYSSKYSMPEHLVTQEFYQNVKDTLKDGGILTANFIVSSNFNNAFTINLDNTLRSIFPNITRHVIGTQNGWQKSATNNANVVYTYHHRIDAPDTIYTDDKNRVYFDKEKAVQ